MQCYAKEVIPIAEKRMFTRKIIDSDEFLDMPLSAQALYFHLNMRADDDGFINNPLRVLRVINGNHDDLKLLIAKRFVIRFEDGVIVIKHWRMHNTLRKDRYTPTSYQEHMHALALKENNAYTERINLPEITPVEALPESGNQAATNWQPSGDHDGNQAATQYRLEENRKENKEKTRAHAREESSSFKSFGEELTDEDVAASLTLTQWIEDLAFKWGLPKNPGNLQQALDIYREFEDCPKDWFEIAVERAGSKDATKSWYYVRGVLRNAKQKGDIHLDGKTGKTGAESRAEQDAARAELQELGILVPFV